MVTNTQWRENFSETWSHYNKSIIKKWDTLSLNEFHTDQASLTLAITDLSIPITQLPSTMNLAGHLPAHQYPDEFFEIDPIIIHYHGLFDENGYITKTSLNQANHRIDSFNSRLRAEKMSSQTLRITHTSTPSITSSPKVIVGSGWWCNDEDSEWGIGCKATRSIPFFSLWLTQVMKCLSPHKIVITDSHSPIKPDHAAYDLIQWVELDKNYGHANDIRTEKINKLVSSTNLIFTIESLTSLLRSGRLSRTKAAIGTVLRIKPLIQMVEGKLDLYKSARTHKKVIVEIIGAMKETTKGMSNICVRILGHNSSEQATALRNEIERVFKNVKISYTENLGPIFCLHLGKKGYGLSWCAE